MKQLHVKDLHPDMVLARPVRGKSGAVVLESGTKLTEHYIRRLRAFGVTHATVETAAPPREPARRPPPADPPGVGAEGTRARVARIKDDDDARKEACGAVARFVESDRLLDLVSIPSFQDRFRRRFRNVLLEAVAQRDIAEELAVLRESDRSLFEHSLHVALFACVVGLAMQYDGARLSDLAVGALLFDIGMTRLPPELYKTHRTLGAAEREALQRHTQEGYVAMSALSGVSQESCKCALLHHERYRGEGYPFGLKGDRIPEFARIVAIADVYDALVSARHHRKAFAPNEAMEYLFASGNYEFDLELVRCFVHHISAYPVASVIRLSNGQVGVVSQVDNGLNHRPIVRIIREADGTRVGEPYEIDLSRHTNVVILHSFNEPQLQFAGQSTWQ